MLLKHQSQKLYSRQPRSATLGQGVAAIAATVVVVVVVVVDSHIFGPDDLLKFWVGIFLFFLASHSIQLFGFAN